MALLAFGASSRTRPVCKAARGCKRLRCQAGPPMAAVAERTRSVIDSQTQQNNVNGKASDDPPLTQQGIQQAHELGVRLQRENISRIYSSPFTRTVQTAQEVATCLGDSAAICIEDGLAEGMLTRLFPAGRPNFRSADQQKSTCPSVDPSYRSVLQLQFPEDYRDAQARCRQIAHVLADRHQSENILLATALVTKEKCSLHIPYCCLTECKRDANGDWTYGLHMNQDFLSAKQEKSDADKQRELWGLDEQTA